MKDSNLVLYIPKSPLPLARPNAGRVLRSIILPKRRGGRDIIDYEKVSPRRLATYFSGIKGYNDVYYFAEKYGLLGLAKIQPKNIYCSPMYGSVAREEIALWYKHATVVRQLLKLYRILSLAKRKEEYDIEAALLNVLHFKWNGSRASVFCVETGQNTNIIIGDDMSPLEITAFVLSVTLGRMLQGGISIGFDSLTLAGDTVPGFRVKEYRYTNFLLAAVYYDLWEMITDNRPVISCGFCGRIIEKVGRRKYCNNRCKQNAYLQRKKDGSD